MVYKIKKTIMENILQHKFLSLSVITGILISILIIFFTQKKCNNKKIDNPALFTQETIKKKIPQATAGFVIDGSLQLVIYNCFQNISWEKSFEKLDYYQMSFSAGEAMVNNIIVSAAGSCLIDGFTKNGKIKETLTAANVSKDCVIGTISALLVQTAFKGFGKTLKKLKNIAINTSSKFINGLTKLGILRPKMLVNDIAKIESKENIIKVCRNIGLNDVEIRNLIFKSKLFPVKVDLMGGVSRNDSKIGKLWVNYDLNAINGVNAIKDDVKNFDKYFAGRGIFIDRMTVSNPMSFFLDDIAKSVKSGGKITIHGKSDRNKYFKKIYIAWKRGNTHYRGLKIDYANSGNFIGKEFDNVVFTTTKEITLKRSDLYTIILIKN